MQPIVESFTTKGRVIEAAKGSLPPKTLCRAEYKICGIGKKNRNNRVYEKAVWDGVLSNDEIKEKLANKSLFFHAEHPTTTQSSGEKIAGVVTGIRIDEAAGDVFATMDVLETPYGQIVDTLLQAGCGIGVSTRADGELEEAIDEGGQKYHRVIPESYRFVTVDFTADPSSFGSEMPLNVQRNVAGAIKAGLDNEKIDRKYATVLLEHLKCKEATTILESIKIDEKHPGCKCLPTEKACKNCKHSQVKEKYTTSADKSGQPANAKAADIVAKKSAKHTGFKITENIECPTCGGDMIGYNDTVICPKCTDVTAEDAGGISAMDPALKPGAPLPVAEKKVKEDASQPILKVGDKVTYQGKEHVITGVFPEDMIVKLDTGANVDVDAIEDFIPKQANESTDVEKVLAKVPELKKFDVKEVEMGIKVEMEHKDIVKGDHAIAGKIALDHLKEMPDYYSKLKQMESGKKPVAEKMAYWECECGNNLKASDVYDEKICPRCHKHMKAVDEVKTEVKEEVNVEPQVTQFLKDNWDVFIDDQDKIDNIVKLFKITPEQAKIYVDNIVNSKATMSSVFAMADESWKHQAETLQEKVGNLNFVIDTYKESQYRHADQITALTNQVTKLQESIKALREIKKQDAERQLRKDSQINKLTEANQLLAKEQEKKVAELKEQHQHELIRSYVAARTKALRLNLAPKALTILESYGSHDEVEDGIRELQNQIREGILQSSIPEKIEVAKEHPIDPKMRDISNKVAKAFRSFGA